MSNYRKTLTGGHKFTGKNGTATWNKTGDLKLHRQPRIPAHELVSIEIVAGEAATKNTTITRLILLGWIGALLFKKTRGGDSYMVAEGETLAAVMTVSRKDLADAHKFVASVRAEMTAARDYHERQELPGKQPAPQDAQTPEPGQKRWWQKTTGELINERRARKDKAPINYSAA